MLVSMRRALAKLGSTRQPTAPGDEPGYYRATTPKRLTELTSGRSSVVRIPGGAATTAGMALTIRPAAPEIAAWLWSPSLLVGQMSTE